MLWTNLSVDSSLGSKIILNNFYQNFYFVSDVVKVAKHHIDGYIKA